MTKRFKPEEKEVRKVWCVDYIQYATDVEDNKDIVYMTARKDSREDIEAFIETMKAIAGLNSIVMGTPSGVFFGDIYEDYIDISKYETKNG